MKNNKLLLMLAALPFALAACGTSGSENKNETPEDKWANLFKEENFTNFTFKNTTSGSGIFMEQSQACPTVYMAIDATENVDVDGTHFKSEELMAIKYVVKKADFHNFYVDNPTFTGKTEDEAADMFGGQMATKLRGEFTSDESNYYISMGGELGSHKEVKYVDMSTDGDLMDCYVGNDEDGFHKISDFKINFDYYFDFEFIDWAKTLKTKYSIVTFDEATNSYKVPLAGADFLTDELPDDAFATLSVKDGKISKIDCTIEIDGTEASQVLEILSYGQTTVTYPTNLLTCEHDESYSAFNDHYHYEACEECDTVLSYEAHCGLENDGRCDKCDFEDVSYSYLEFDGISCEHVELGVNNVTKEVTSVYISNCNYNYDEANDRYYYTCDSEECDLVIYESYESVQGENICVQIGRTTYSFYVGDTKVHDDVILDDYYDNHCYEVSSIGNETEKDYSGEGKTCYEATISCDDCGSTWECAIWLVEEDEFTKIYEAYIYESKKTVTVFEHLD